MLIGLHAPARSGKDYIASYLIEKYGFKRYAFADILREALYNLNPTIITELNLVNKCPVMIEGKSVEGVCVEDYGESYLNAWYLQDIVDNQGWEEAKKISEVRSLLQRMGTEVGRELFGENFWVERTFNQIERDIRFEDLYSNKANVVITDVRFNNEAQSVWDFDGFIWKIDAGLPPVNNHISDAGIDDEYISEVIDNKGKSGGYNPDVFSIVDKLVRKYES